jgi:hypothetical protein
MGLEATCAVRFGQQASDGKAQLEATELLFRGGFRLRIPFKEVASVEAKKGNLVVVWPEGRATFAIGKDAEKWALKVRYPRSLLDKLGVKAGSRVAVVGSFPGDFLKDLAGRTGGVKVVSFSDSLSGLKMVIPVAQRKKKR